jgi:hypothetical protein
MPTASVGDFLLMAFTLDANSSETAPGGWTFVGRAAAASSSGSLAAAHTALYYRIADGTEGSSVTVSFSGTAWPAGQASVTGVILSYSGVDPSAPVETWASTTAAPPAAAALAHPQLTTSVASDWIVTVRGNSGGTYAATTDSVGGDTSRADYQNSLYPLTVVVLDSNGGVPAGTQAQRTTTTSSGTDMGSTGFSLALKPASSASASTVVAQCAAALGTAYPPAAATANLGWDACAELPRYLAAVDWEQLGLTAPGAPLNTNGHFLRDLTGWYGFNATAAPALSPDGRALNTALVTPNGTSASGGLNLSTAVPVTGGQSYIAQSWVWSPAATGWADVRAAVDWYTPAGAYISSGLGSASSTPGGAWTLLQQTLAAPSNAGLAVPRFRFGGTPPSSAPFYVWGVYLFDPSQPTTFLNPGPLSTVNPELMSGVGTTMGRDQNRQLNPASLGTANCTVNNSSRMYSPENPASPLSGDLDAGRDAGVQVTFNGQTYALFRGRVNGFNLTVDRSNRSVALTFQDPQGLISNTKVTTPVYAGKRTGELIGIVLDAAGWTGPRDIDPGGTVAQYWWLDAVQAFTALSDLVRSEGPPSVAYIAPDGTFTFRDRHHRLVREQSTDVQAVFAEGYAGTDVCTAPSSEVGYDFAYPFTYDHGWLNIINSVEFDVPVYGVSGVYSAVWTSSATYTVQIGQTVQVIAAAGGPFIDAILPQAGTDYTVTGPGTLTVAINRTSGSSVTISLSAAFGMVQVTNLQIRAYPVQTTSTVKVIEKDPSTGSSHTWTAPPGRAWRTRPPSPSRSSSSTPSAAPRSPSRCTPRIRAISSRWCRGPFRTGSTSVTTRSAWTGTSTSNPSRTPSSGSTPPERPRCTARCSAVSRPWTPSAIPSPSTSGAPGSTTAPLTRWCPTTLTRCGSGTPSRSSTTTC